MAQVARSSIENNINILHTKHDHPPSEVIKYATSGAMGIHLTGMFKPCDDCTLKKKEKGWVSKTDVEHSKILEEKLFLTSAPYQLPFLEVRSIGQWL